MIGYHRSWLFDCDSDLNPADSRQINLRVGGIILCGGESRRMGAPKAMLRFGDEYLLQGVARVVAQVASPIVFASRRGVEVPVTPAFPIVLDGFDNAGPLAGIAAGMKALRDCCDAVLVVPCDHPFLLASVLQRIVEFSGGSEAVVPQLAGKLFPTLAIYPLSRLATLEDMLSKRQFRAQDFALQCNPIFLSEKDLADIDPQQQSFGNMNEPADYDAALATARHPVSKGLPCAR